MTQWEFSCAASCDSGHTAHYYFPAEARAQSRDGEVELSVASEKLRRPFKVLNDHLAANGWLVGKRFTVADINMAEIVRYGAVEGKLMKDFPALAAWLESLRERDGFKAMWAKRLAEPA